MLVIKERTKLQLEIYGTKIEVLKPTLLQISSMQEKLREENSDSFKLFLEFLEGAGIPKDVLKLLEPEHATDIVDYLCGAKKN